MLKITGMLLLFGLDWLYQKLMTAWGILCVLILFVAILALFKE